MSPPAVMCPTLFAPHSVNQHPPSGAGVIAGGRESRSGRGNSRMWPSWVRQPIWPALISTKHIAPSVPLGLPTGPAAEVGRGWSVACPSVVMRPMALAVEGEVEGSVGPGVMNETLRVLVEGIR